MADIKRFKIALPWFFGAVGGTKWLRERGDHVPDAMLASCAQAAGVSPAQWRAVEQTQVKLVTDGINIISQS